MEGYPYSTAASYPDSGDSSPRSRDIIDNDHSVASLDDQPPPSARVKLMCSYGGRIQPRPHDNQLSYVGGDTKILAVDRSIRFPAMISRLYSLSGASDDLLLKYQLPGEDLDALVSVTNDDDLDHLMVEYDRLHRFNTKPIQRLRLFLFSPPIAKTDRPPSSEAVHAPVTMTENGGPDYLFGLDKGFVPPPAVKVRDPMPKAPPTEDVISPEEVQRQVQELQHLQESNNNMQRNASDESLARVYAGEYYQSPPTPTPVPQQTAAYWPEHHQLSMTPAGRFASVAGGGDQQFFFIPSAGPAPGVYPPPAASAAGQGYYTTMQRMVPTAATTKAAAYEGATAAYEGATANTLYTMAADAPCPAQMGKGAYSGGVQVAYDSAGRAVYYQAVGSVALKPESKALNPPQVS